jgi:PAS domain S-box-containing protein
MVVPDAFRGRADDIAARLREGRSWTGQLAVRRRDGSSFRVEGTAAPIFDEDGDLVGVVGVIREISERGER